MLLRIISIFQIIQKRKQVFETHKKTENNLVRNKTLVDMLLQLENTAMTLQEIRDEINSIIVAGFDTVSVTFNYILVMLGSFPEAQAKVFHEIEKICGSNNAIINRTMLSRLQYLKAIIKETLRIFPLLPIITRKIDKTIDLSKCTLYEGHSCILLVKALHHHSLWGEDAEEFKPERWLDTQKVQESASLFAGFGRGKRNCIGKNYALVFLQIVLVHIIRNYKILANHKDLVHNLGVMLTPISGHYISLQKR